MTAPIYGPSILSLQVLLVASSFHAYNIALASNVIKDTRQSSNALPSIWQDGRDAGQATDGQEAMYRFLGEINLRDSDKSYRFAELASTSRRRFRFDLIEAASGRQFGYLADFTTGEMFRFTPFICSLTETDKLNKIVSLELKSLMPMMTYNSSSGAPIEELLLSAGIGSLWLYGFKNGAKYRAPLQQPTNETSDVLLKNLNLDKLQRFTVQPTDVYPYELSFFFKPDQTIEPKSLLLILVATNDHQSDYVMRIRFLEAWSTLESSNRSTLDLATNFELPLGYGCRRRQQSEESAKQPSSLLKSSLTGPHLIRLNVVSLHPPGGDHKAPLDKWRGHSSKIRLIAGRLSLTDHFSSDYMVIESQDFGPQQEWEVLFGGPTKAASVRRRQRVWDLGQSGLTNFSNESKAVYLDIDERRAKCLGYGQRPTIESVNVNLEQSDVVEDKTREAAQVEVEVGVPNLNELTLNNEFVQLLFGSSVAGFQLVQQNVQSRIIELIFERRVPYFQLHGKNGSVIWRGPVSLIRKEWWTIRSGKRANEITPSTDFDAVDRLQTPPTKVSGSVVFLAANSAGIISKLSMELIESRPISNSQLHQQISVAALLCYTQLESLKPATNESGKTNPAGSLRKSSSRHNVAPLVVLNYPLDIEPATQNYGKTGANSIQFHRHRHELEAQIYDRFLVLIHTLSIGRFDTIRLAELSTQMDNDSLNIRIKARLIEQPALLSYVPEVGPYRFSDSQSKNTYSTELKERSAGCADSCRHLNCQGFVYCSLTQECQLSYSQVLPASENSSLAQDCQLYRKTDLAIKRPAAMSAGELVRTLKDLLDSRSEELALTVQLGTSNSVRLIPSSIESSSSPNTNSISGDARANLLQQAEYELVLSGRCFKANEHLRVAHHIQTYQNCELLCSQLDCSSFSYCPLEQVCYLDNEPEHDNTEALEQVTEPTHETCHVFAQNHLSKFQMAGPQVSSNSIDFHIDRTLTAGTARDCAASCIHQSADFKCRSFYYCTSGDATTTCLLRSTWHPSSNVSLSASGESSGEDSSHTSNSHANCQLYKRSYLVEFDRFSGRELAGETFVLDAMDGTLQVGADECALECVSQLDQICVAFQICRQTIEGTSIKPQCSFRFDSQSLPSLKADGALPRMVDSDLCTVFVPAVDSELFGTADSSNKKFHTSKNSTSSILELLWELPILMGSGLAIGLTLAASLRSFGLSLK